MPVSVGLISLGCAKNLTDSEIIIGHLTEAGMLHTQDLEIADVLIINTCAFIDKAKQEAIDTIIGAAEARAQGAAPKNQKIIVAGCLSQRFSKELPNLLPEVDAFIGIDEIKDVTSIIESVLKNTLQEKSIVTKTPRYIPEYDTPRYRLTPKHTAYVKIAEGCNHGCAFCAIPLIRGRHRSRTQDSIVREVRHLVENGVREINLIAQDTTFFGMDRWENETAKRTSQVDSGKGESLASLLREINTIPGDFWVRILYTHPAHWSDELIETMATCEKIAPYADIPIQHIAANQLQAMNRITDGDFIRDLIKRIRARIPNISLRTTFIVGFPGETESEYEELLTFIRDFNFERAGVFAYSKEENTKAFKMKGHIHHRTKQRRWNEVMELLFTLASERNQSYIGKTMKVLVDAPGFARSISDAPDVDGCVIVPEDLPVGEFANVVITDAIGYDLIAE